MGSEMHTPPSRESAHGCKVLRSGSFRATPELPATQVGRSAALMRRKRQGTHFILCNLGGTTEQFIGSLVPFGMGLFFVFCAHPPRLP